MIVPDYEARLTAVLDAYPAGYSTDHQCRWIVRVRADDLRELLGDVGAYRNTMQVIAAEPSPSADGALGRQSTAGVSTPPILPSTFLPSVDVGELERLLARAAKHVSLPLDRDMDRSDGEYGSGPDTHSGYEAPFLIDADGCVLFRSDGSDIALIEEEYDEDYHRAWDAASCDLADLLIAAVNTLPALISRSKQVDGLVEALRNLAQMARTSGGVAGRDDGLIAACEGAESIIAQSSKGGE